MRLLSSPSTLSGSVAIPGSKSHTIRAIICALLAEGRSFIRYPLESGDTNSVLQAACQLGAKVITRCESFWEIQGTGGALVYEPDVLLDLGNSGTGLRLLTAVAALGSQPIRFDGDHSLRTRKMTPLLNALQDLGVRVESDNGHAPLRICGPIRPGRVLLSAESSQFLSALLFVMPLLKGHSWIDLRVLNEKPYVNITLKYLRAHAMTFDYTGDLMHFTLAGSEHYSPFDMVIPSDFSTAAFSLVASMITRSPLTLLNLDFDDIQGDKAVFDYVKGAGMRIVQKSNETQLFPPDELQALNLDLNATPDALPALAVLGACTRGVTRLFNVPQARIKESDRIACMCSELRKMNVQIEELQNGLVIHGNPDTLTGAEVCAYGDHRIAMALAIAGLRAAGSTIIDGAEVAEVTYPNFIRDFVALGAQLKVID